MAVSQCLVSQASNFSIRAGTGKLKGAGGALEAFEELNADQADDFLLPALRQRIDTVSGPL